MPRATRMQVSPGEAPRLCVVGDLALDYYLKLSDQPAADEKSTAIWSLRAPGGTGANAAATMAALGSQVDLHSVIGDDPVGSWLKHAMAEQGVRTRGVRERHGTTTQATILLEPASRRVIVDRGVADHLADLDPAGPSGGLLTYVTGAPAVIRHLSTVPRKGQMVAGVEAWMAQDPGLVDALRSVDLVITNSAGWQAFAADLSGMVDTVETRGSQGAAIHYATGVVKHVPSLTVDAVDATGAGDCFAGALCHYLTAGAELQQAAALACIAAALSTRGPGAQSSLPTDTQVRAAAATLTPNAVQVETR